MQIFTYGRVLQTSGLYNLLKGKIGFINGNRFKGVKYRCYKNLNIIMLIESISYNL